MDKVELAFRKFDTNRDGFLSRDEFDLVRTSLNLHCVSFFFWRKKVGNRCRRVIFPFLSPTPGRK